MINKNYSQVLLLNPSSIYDNFVVLGLKMLPKIVWKSAWHQTRVRCDDHGSLLFRYKLVCMNGW